MFSDTIPSGSSTLVSPSKSPCPVGLLVGPVSGPSVLVQIHRQGLSLHSSEAEAPTQLSPLRSPAETDQQSEEGNRQEDVGSVNVVKVGP